jgi:hypothetical protein
VGALLLSAGPARAHRLEAQVEVDRARKQVKVESWFETGDSPRQATVKVFRPDGALLAEGPLDEKGEFVFGYEDPEDLRVVIDAPGGHRAELTLSAARLGKASTATNPSRARDLLVGVAFLLALGAFVLSLRNARQLRRLSRAHEQDRADG